MFQSVTTPSKRTQADLIVVPFFQGKKGAEPLVNLPDLKEAIEPVLKAGDFEGKEGMTLLSYLKGQKEQRLLFLGLGGEKNCNLETLRRSFGVAMKRCHNKKWPHINVVVPPLKKWDKEEVVRAICEGMGLASYLFEEWKSKENRRPYYVKKISLIGVKDSKILQKTLGILSGVNLARDLINRNALDITPQTLVIQAKALARRFTSVKTTALNKKQMEKEKLGLLLAVSNGSSVDPALIMVEYRGAPRSKELTMVVGKGITFDTGGLNLKPTKFIEDMRVDMSGGAAALGIIQAAASIKLKANIIVVVPASENAIGSRSYKPGDVYRSYQGKTVEITNTDAEGRLVLADALAYGQKKYAPTRIIDLATLTGAIVIALGTQRAGLFSNNDKFAKLCEQAGEKTGEKVWRMPLDPEYKSLLRSNIADIMNAATKRVAGSVTAALFLQEFIVKNTPWIHLDIAGTAFLDSPQDYHLTLATGAGVRLVIELLECLP